MPSSSRRGSRAGAPGSYTDLGPPDRTRALASWARTVSGSTSQATTSEKTWHSRMRRAMSWAYWAPKSSTRTVSWPGAGRDPRAPGSERAASTAAREALVGAGVVMGGRITNSRSGLLARLGQEYLERERDMVAPWCPDLAPHTERRVCGAFFVPAKEND